MVITIQRRPSAACAAIVFGAAALVTLLAASPAPAATTDGKFAVEDSGRVTCRTMSAARAAKSPSYGRMLGFVEGYVTAANRYENDTFDLTPYQNAGLASLIVLDHCRTHPTDILGVVAQKLVLSLKPQRLTGFSPLVTLPGQPPTVVYQAVLQRAQAELVRRGLYAGAATATDAPGFKLALTKFQQSAKLTPTGQPDTATLWKLLAP